MPSPLVLALLSLALGVALVVLVHRRRVQESGPQPAHRAVDPDDLVSALVVELAVTPEAVKHRRRSRPEPSDPTASTPTASTPTASTPDPVPAPTTVDPPVTGPPSAAGVWAARRSPYASGAVGAQQISLPDDDADFDISWRRPEHAAGTAHGVPTPLAKATQVSVTGRIEVGDADEAVPWQARDDHW